VFCSQAGTRKTPVFWRLARLEKRLDLGSATRNATPQAPCTELHGRYRRPKELAQYAKNPGKTRVFERRGQDSNYWLFSLCFVIVRKVPFSLDSPPKNNPQSVSSCFRVFGVFRGSLVPRFRVFGVFRGSHTPCFRVFGVFRGSHTPCFRVFGVFRGSHTPCFRVSHPVLVDP
jgi:hypothetical protein